MLLKKMEIKCKFLGSESMLMKIHELWVLEIEDGRQET
jgi:hypothetical protein